MLRFRSSELLPVLEEAQSDNCRVVLIQDHGVYFISEFAERTIEVPWTNLAYAIGCNPRVDAFDKWWNTAQSELGGDGLREYFDLSDPVFRALLSGAEDLLIEAHHNHLSLQAAPPPLSSRH